MACGPHVGPRWFPTAHVVFELRNSNAACYAHVTRASRALIRRGRESSQVRTIGIIPMTRTRQNRHVPARPIVRGLKVVA
jgi:hypothetical protein